MIKPKDKSDLAHTVLVVEDEPLIRLMIADELREAGLTVVEASCAAEALDYVDAAGRPSLVFSDIRMPGEMDGFALARTLRDRFPRLAIILTSGHAASGDTMPELRMIPKPYRIESVREMILAAIEVGGAAHL